MNEVSLSMIDVLIMVGYAIFIIAYGLYHAKRDSSEDYFLAGRDSIWPIVGISLFAANISSHSLVGLASSAYQSDAHVFNYEWLATVVLVFFTIFFLPFYLRSRVYTMPEFLERRYDSRSRYYFSFVTVVGNVLVDTAAALYVGNIILKLVFPTMPGWAIIVILAFAAAAYTIPGGLNSVIQTEVLQAILLFAGSIALTYFAMVNVGGWEGLMATLDAKAAAGAFADKGVYSVDDMLSMVRPLDDEFMPWTGLLLGAPILGFYFWANNQFMVQRVLSAKDMDHGRWGALFAGLLKLPVFFIMVLPGLAAIVIYDGMDISGLNYSLPDGSVCEDLADCPNATFPLLMFNLMPTGFLGLVLAGLMAAMMSSVSATFNSASTLVTMDFVKPLVPGITSKGLVRVGQGVTLILVVLASLWAPVIENFGSLWEYLQLVIAYIAPPVAATFIIGLFYGKSNSDGAIAGLIFGFLVSVSVVIAQLTAGVEAEETGYILADIHFLHLTFVVFVLSGLVNIIVSHISKKEVSQEALEQYTWTKKIFIKETEELIGLPWWKNYRIQSIIVLVITAVMVGWLW